MGARVISSEQKKALQLALQALVEKHEYLDDALYLLQNNLSKIKLDINRYTAQIEAVILNAYSPDKVALDVQEALGDFLKNMKAAIESGAMEYRRANVQAFVEAAYSQYSTQVRLVSTNMNATIFSKATQFKTLAQAAEIPLARQADIAAYTIRQVEIGGKKYTWEPLNNIWEKMNQEYGQRDTIQYRNGANHPLRSYVDARLTTSSAETQRHTTTLQASANGVLFVKTSVNGTTDSCSFWEGKRMFTSEAARLEAQKRWPKVDFSGVKTVQEVRADKTHMFKFHCAHILRPDSVQFSDEFEQEIAAERAPKIPQDIDERALYEKLSGKEWQSARRTTHDNFVPVPKDPNYAPRYTIQ